MTGRLRFLTTRLRNASWPELNHRVREAAWCRWVLRQAKAGKLSSPMPRIPASNLDGLCLPRLAAPADGATLAPATPRVAPGDDVRSLWEPARLQEPAARLLGRNGAGGAAARRAAAEEVLRWLEANPFPHGLHYRSAMECALRIPVFLYCLRAGDLPEGARRALGEAVYRHAWWTAHRLSLFSSLGNHTVTEAVGLVFAGGLFRGTADGRHWLARGVELLSQELPHQVLPDGGPVEQSFAYHRFVLDLYWLAADFLERNGLHDCAAWKPGLRRGEAFLDAFEVAPGAYPTVGDSDDGHAVAPGLHPVRGTVEERAASPASPGVRSLAAGQWHATTFPDAGYTVVRGRDASVLTFDHGPLGMAPLYNHGHADALSITLARDGVEFLVDPGTYRYNNVPAWRRYFKGTRAHNTACVDGQDQAVQETSFIWSKPFQGRLERCQAGDSGLLLEASHDGYERLKNPVTHRRAVLVREDGTILVGDRFAGRGTHRFELNFHLHPEAAVAEHEGWFRVSRGGRELFLRPLRGLGFSVVRGNENPIHGWYSRCYGHKEPCPVLTVTRQGVCAEVRFLTALCWDRPDNLEELTERSEEGEMGWAIG